LRYWGIKEKKQTGAYVDVSVENLKKLITEGETSRVEFKLNSPRQGDLAERLCGFANSQLGGMVIIGVEDKTWRITGIENATAAVDDLLKAATLSNPAITFVEGTPQIIEIEGKKLVVAQIKANDGTLYQAGGVYWLRRGTHTRPMETTQVAEFLHRQGLLDWETQPNKIATLADLDMRKFERYVQNLADMTKRPSRVSSQENLLVLLECAAWVEDKTTNERVLRPTNAGLLLFGESPRYFFPQTEIICTYYKDNTGLRRYDDRRIISGTLTEQIDQAEAFLKMYTPVGAHVEGFHRVDEPSIPIEALREAVVNAIVHRDYSLRGEAVRIFYYTDRVEIHNPGLLMPGILLDDLKQGKTRSKPRNPVIASILRDMPGNYMERVGTGIPFMLNQMHSLGLPMPEFQQLGEFVVTFWNREVVTNSPVILRAVQSEQPVVQPVVQPLEGFESEQSWTRQPEKNRYSLETREERQRIALEYVRQHGYITNKIYKQLTDISENTATHDLEILVERGSLNRTGRGPSRRYVL
jgi:ATP-dependent DNA helicase RecG